MVPSVCLLRIRVTKWLPAISRKLLLTIHDADKTVMKTRCSFITSIWWFLLPDHLDLELKKSHWFPFERNRRVRFLLYSANWPRRIDLNRNKFKSKFLRLLTLHWYSLILAATSHHRAMVKQKCWGQNSNREIFEMHESLPAIAVSHIAEDFQPSICGIS